MGRLRRRFSPQATVVGLPLPVFHSSGRTAFPARAAMPTGTSAALPFHLSPVAHLAVSATGFSCVLSGERMVLLDSPCLA